MKNFLSDNRLFIKIFFWFWLATLLINGIFFVLPVIVSSEYFPGGWRVVTETALNIYGQSAAEIYERDGSEAAKNYLEKQLGATIRDTNCNVLDPANSCWQALDVIVLGQGIETEKFDQSLIEKYMAAGKPIYTI